MTKESSIKGFLIFCMLSVFTSPAFAFEWGSKELEIEKVAIKLTREVVSGGYGIVRTDELKKWIDDGKKMLIVDTMPYEASYKKNHIPGAIPFELPIPEMAEMESATQSKFIEALGPDKGRKLVFYCGFTKCGRSHNGALWAKTLGYTNVYRHPGGILAWLQAEYPVASVN